MLSSHLVLYRRLSQHGNTTGRYRMAALSGTMRCPSGFPSRRSAARTTTDRRGAVCSISTSRGDAPRSFQHGAIATPLVPLRVPLSGQPRTAPLEATYDYDYDYDGEASFAPGLALDRDGSTLGLEVAEDAASGMGAGLAQALQGVPAWQRMLLVRPPLVKHAHSQMFRT